MVNKMFLSILSILIFTNQPDLIKLGIKGEVRTIEKITYMLNHEKIWKKNNLTKTTFFNKFGFIEKITFEDDDYGLSSHIFKYNKDTLKFIYLETNESKRLYSNFEYNNKNVVIEKKYLSDSKIPNGTNKFYYNKDGFLIKKISQGDNIYVKNNVSYYVYDDKNSLQKEIIINQKDSIIKQYKKGLIYSIIYPDKYEIFYTDRKFDDEGNCVEETERFHFMETNESKTNLIKYKYSYWKNK